ncbi:unnamed protein product [Schistosoma mattheei]|uniref:Uncharacterized protein n=1 Tax=Schistosoma mattheei TaxID=31246 RepID=A0A3P8G3D6_9TREM|nr:unnamed protein product [Schistosoma mattheei]
MSLVLHVLLPDGRCKPVNLRQLYFLVIAVPGSTSLQVTGDKT